MVLFTVNVINYRYNVLGALLYGIKVTSKNLQPPSFHLVNLY
jgi:hypothetical protein